MSSLVQGYDEMTDIDGKPTKYGKKMINDAIGMASMGVGTIKLGTGGKASSGIAGALNKILGKKLKMKGRLSQSDVPLKLKDLPKEVLNEQVKNMGKLNPKYTKNMNDPNTMRQFVKQQQLLNTELDPFTGTTKAHVTNTRAANELNIELYNKMKDAIDKAKK